jgi:hypothetical protein
MLRGETPIMGMAIAAARAGKLVTALSLACFGVFVLR